MNRYRIYDESRRFDKVFPTFDIFAINTIPYIYDSSIVNTDNLLITYNKLKLRYGSSYFAYERNGTIYQKNTEYVNRILLTLSQYNKIKNLIDEKFVNEDVSTFFDTDNENEEDVVGSLTSKTEHKSYNSESYNKMLNKANTLLAETDKIITDYQAIMLNEIYYKRGSEGRNYE